MLCSPTISHFFPPCQCAKPSSNFTEQNRSCLTAATHKVHHLKDQRTGQKHGPLQRAKMWLSSWGCPEWWQPVRHPRIINSYYDYKKLKEYNFCVVTISMDMRPNYGVRKQNVTLTLSASTIFALFLGGFGGLRVESSKFQLLDDPSTDSA